MAQDPISAAAARLDSLLQTQEAIARRVKRSPTQLGEGGTSFPFLMPDAGRPYSRGPMVDSTCVNYATTNPALAAELGVGDTIRRNGVPSDLPMKVTRVDDDVVYATLTDNEGSREVAFSADQVDVVTKAPTSETFPDITPYQNAVVLSASAPSVYASSAAAATVESTNVSTANAAVSASTRSTDTRSLGTTTATNVPTAPQSADDSSPPFVLLPDGSKQFGYAPTGPVVNIVPNKQPAVPTAFGVGATFRIKGISFGPPMTVLRVGDGIVTAQYTDELGTREVPFIPGQLDLVTPAP
ncbi:MAG: hypothetical protein ABJB66_03065 [Gemmatimonadaceae bacterium]